MATGTEIPPPWTSSGALYKRGDRRKQRSRLWDWSHAVRGSKPSQPVLSTSPANDSKNPGGSAPVRRGPRPFPKEIPRWGVDFGANPDNIVFAVGETDAAPMGRQGSVRDDRTDLPAAPRRPA